MHRMADAVSRPTVPQSELAAGAAQKKMVVGIFKVRLQKVVIDILGREFGLDSRDLHRFEFEHDHRSGGVLGEGLIDFETDLVTGVHTSFNQVAFDKFVCDRVTHGVHLLIPIFFRMVLMTGTAILRAFTAPSVRFWSI
jgi:hypothetical protein